MSKYSRKVRTWGGLPEHTEHRNKAGKVTARTRYFEGKAITTRRPKAAANTRPGYRRSGSASFGLSNGASMFLGGMVLLILVIAGIGWVIGTVGESLTGFWPIFGVVAAWVLAAGWVLTVAHAVYAGVDRVDEEGYSFLTIVVSAGQLVVVVAGGVMATFIVALEFTAMENLGRFFDYAGLSAMLVVPVIVISSIVFAVRGSKLWLLLPVAGIILTIILATAGALFAMWFVPVTGYIVVMFQYNRERIPSIG